MTNTPYKNKKLPSRIKSADATARLLSHPAPLFRGPWKVGLTAADSTPAARRVLVCQHNGGSASWMVLDDTPTLTPQNYPEHGVWRTVSKSRFVLAPGCQLEAHVIAIRSGLSQWNGTTGSPPVTGWHSAGPGGRIRITVDYENLSAQTAQALTEIDLPPSLETDGAEPKAAGAAWGYLVVKHVPLLAPAAVLGGTPAELEKWSENTTVWVTIEHRDGARVIQCAIQEVPYEHVVEDQKTTEVSIHGWPVGEPGPPRPQTDAADGATYEEHRFGTARALHVAGRQGARLGPVIAQWTSYAETLAEITDTIQDPIQVSSTSFIGVSVGSTISSWSADAPGYPIPGQYAARAPENLSTRLDGSAAIPVRIWAEVRWSGTGFNTGVLRFQSSSRAWVDIELSQATIATTWTEVDVTGWLEATVAVDDGEVNLMDFAKVTGGTLEVRNWSVHFGEFPIAS